MSDTVQDVTLALQTGEMSDRQVSVNGHTAVASSCVMARRPLGAGAPLSLAQQQIWLHSQLAPNVPMYHEMLVLEATGDVHVTLIEQNWRSVLERHAILRTRFPLANGEPVQEITERIAKIQVTDLRLSGTESLALEIQQFLQEELARPFALAEEPPIRAQLLRLPRDRWMLAITLHALLADDESLNLLASSLQHVANEFDKGANSIPESPFEYADYAYGQRSRLSETTLAENAAYWRQRLHGFSPALELPTDRSRPAVKQFRGATESFRLPEAVAGPLQELAEREGIKLDTLLCAALLVLLFRYTGQTDLVIGWIVSSRDEELGDKHAGLIGPFSQTIVTRAQLDGELGFSEFVRRVNDSFALDYQHKDVPLDCLSTELQTGWDPSRNTFFQVLFSTASRATRTQTGWRVSELEIPSGAAKVDVQLQMVEDPNGIGGRFTFDTALFDGETIRRLAQHFETLLEAIGCDSDQPLFRMPLLTESELRQIIVDWNDTQADYPRDICIHQLFELQVNRTPGDTAVLYEGAALTYGELNERANRLAATLQAYGIGPEALVGICLERSLEMVVGLLGILKAGAAYVPLDPAYPADRIQFMLEDAEVAVLLTQERLLKSLPQSSARVICLDANWEILSYGSEKRVADVNPQNRAYVIYTSGSTGKPKGVEIPHGAVVNFLASMSKAPGMTREDKLLAVTTLSFDIAGLEIYLPLTVGASLEIVSREIASDGKELAQKLNESQATVMQATPATWRMLIEAGWAGDGRLKVLCGGEALPRNLANQLLQRAGCLWNMYGPTETTIWSTTSKVAPGEEPLTIGKPIANTELFVLDKWLQPTPIGVAGELHIGGEGLARGYLKRPELSCEKFIRHPLSRDPGARLYKTGDLARYLPSGEIEFRGRIDHQVKIRGFRIELGEIEARLRRFRGITDAVVVAREDRSGGQRLVAYFISSEESGPGVGDLRAFLKETLPEHMIPSAFVALRALPLTPNGKVDRRALPSPDDSALGQGQELVEARDVLEAQLVRIWENALGVRPIGIRHNFFELGGHSLVAVKLTHQIGQALGKNVPVATLLEAPTIEQLAAILRQEGWSSPWSSLVPVQTSGSKTPFFCVHGAAGTVIRFRNLARHLDADRPFYALQPQGLDPRYACHTRIEDMAAHYLTELRSIQPGGPYFFGGYSLGGLIALEMAQQLVAEGHEPPWVGLFDTFCPAEPGAHPSSEAFAALFRDLLSGGRVFLRSPNTEKRRQVSRIVRTLSAGVERRVREVMLPARLKAVRRACRQAAAAYAPRPYNGPVVLFRSKYKPLTQFRDPHAGWQKYAVRGLEIREVDGDHDSVLLEPQVRLIAEQLSACLETASSDAEAGVARHRR